MEVRDTGLRDDPVESTEPDRLQPKVVADSTESRLETGAMFEEAVDPE